MKVLAESWARINSMHFTYGEMAEQAYIRYLSAEKQLACTRGNDPEAGIRIERALSMEGIAVIVFAAMYLEAMIYDLAGIHLGDKYATEHLDKLDVLSKWVVVPQLVMGKSLRKDQAPYASLRELIKLRNGLVHSKSEQFDSRDPAQIARHMKDNERFRKGVHIAYRALVLVPFELEWLASDYAVGKLHSRYAEKGWPSVPEEVEGVISNYRRMFEDSIMVPSQPDLPAGQS